MAINWDDPYQIYNNDGSFIADASADPWQMYNLDGTINIDSSTNGSSTPVDTSGWKQVGSKIVDGLGNVVKQLTSGETLKDAIAAFQSGASVYTTKSFNSDMKTAAVDNLTALANSISGMDQPELSQYVSNLARAVQLGTIQPAQALAAVQEQTAAKGIRVPEQFTSAINDTLGRLDQVSKQGYTMIERAAIQKALNQIMTQSRGEQEAIKTNMMERGQWGAGQELVNRNMVTQAAANTAAQTGLDIEAAGLKRALEALAAKGDLGLKSSEQSFEQQKAITDAQDLINKTNAEMRQQMAEQNAQREQQAILQSSANAYGVQDKNIAQSNLEKQKAYEAAQQEYQNTLDKNTLAANVAGTAGKNAASVLGKSYEAQLNAQSDANKGVQATANNTSSEEPTWKKVVKVGGSILGSIFSDEDVKENKKELSDDEFDSILNELVPTKFTYQKSVQKLGAPSGQVVGVMAQDLEKTPAGAAIVVDTPNGKMINKDKALSLALAALASMNKRVGDLEGRNG